MTCHEMADAFVPSIRALLATVFSSAELTELEAHLSTPNEALHLRCNSLRCDRDTLLGKLQAEPSLKGYAVELHPLLWDVLVIRRQPCAEALVPYREMAHIHNADRFAERRRRGLPLHEVFVDIKCGEAVLRGADIFVKGVFGASAGLDAGDRVSVYADMHSVLLRGSVCESLEGMRLLGIGTCLIERGALFRASSGVAVTMEHVVFGDLPSINGILDGEVYAQTLPSLTVAHVLDAQPGDRVLDMCAAPGSKATHIATNFLREGAGSCIVACERNHGKIAKMAALCDVFGLRSVEPTRADSTRLVRKECVEGGVAGGVSGAVVDAMADAAQLDACTKVVGAKGGRRGSKGGVPALSHARESFDRVLLDPPCSAIGLRPRLVLASAGGSGGAIEQAAAYQRLFLWVAVQMLRVGGTLVYSTCTLTAEENEGQVALALRAYPCLRLVQAAPRVGSEGRAGLGLSEAQRVLVQRFEPREGGEGFFIAKFVKVAPVADELPASPSRSGAAHPTTPKPTVQDGLLGFASRSLSRPLLLGVVVALLVGIGCQMGRRVRLKD